MAKDIDITYAHYTIPKKIVIDGVNYPITQHNLDVIAEYEKTNDENTLDKLSNYSFNI